MISSLYRIKREVLYGELAGMFERLRDTRYAVIKGEALSNQIFKCKIVLAIAKRRNALQLQYQSCAEE